MKTKKGIQRLHFTWLMMLDRCSNPYHSSYARYGGRGITVCQRWTNFQSFLEDVGVPDEGQTLDRINSDLGYCPENFRWATMIEQSRNRSSTRLLTYEGRTQCIVDWAKEISQITKVPYHTITSRLYNGFTVSEALSGQRVKPLSLIARAALNGISQEVLSMRLYGYKWDVERAITQPQRSYKRKNNGD